MSTGCSACESGGPPSPYAADGKVPVGRVMDVGGIETYATWPGMSEDGLSQQTKLVRQHMRLGILLRVLLFV